MCAVRRLVLYLKMKPPHMHAGYFIICDLRAITLRCRCRRVVCATMQLFLLRDFFHIEKILR